MKGAQARKEGEAGAGGGGNEEANESIGNTTPLTRETFLFTAQRDLKNVQPFVSSLIPQEEMGCERCVRACVCVSVCVSRGGFLSSTAYPLSFSTYQ